MYNLDDFFHKTNAAPLLVSANFSVVDLSLCTNFRQLEHAQLERDTDRRATWLETRNLEENFKELVYLSMQEVS